VIVFYLRQNIQGVHVQRVAPFPPGASVTLPLGTAGRLGGYAIGFFDADGKLVARIPSDGGNMTAGRAAQLDPTRPDEFTDSWVIDDRTRTPAGQPYVVTIRNQTPDRWDEVALFYAERGRGTQGLSIANVEPNGAATFPLCDCEDMDGYTFNVWVDGLRVVLEDGQLQFPATGLMTARRSADYRTDLDPCRDEWLIGDGS
jgi:hypothetical protein